MKPFHINTWKPSDYLAAAVRGLKKHAADPRFVVNMMTFGEINERQICFGCVATAAIAEISGQIYPDVIEGIDLDGNVEGFDWLSLQEAGLVTTGLDHDQLRLLELAYDSARRGELHRLFRFCKTKEPADCWNNRWCMRTDDWEKQLPIVEATIAQLKEAGL